MQAIADQALSIPFMQRPGATRTAHVARRPDVKSRQPASGVRNPLLDRDTETRRFRVLNALGLHAIGICLRSPGLCCGGDNGDDRIPLVPCADALRVVAPPVGESKPAGRPAAELQQMAQRLLAIASQPASGQADAPALLVDYLAACDGQAAARLLAMPGLRPLLTCHGRHGEPTLHNAVQRNLPVVVQRLIAMSPDPAALLGAESVLGINALLLACMQGNVALAQALLAHPAAVALAAEVPPDRWNPLMAAAIDGHTQIAALLLGTSSAAAQALARNEEGRDALMLAAVQGRLGVAELLLAQPSAQLQAQAIDHDGRNALMLAVGANHASLARFLLAHPASAGQVIEVTGDGDDALIVAARNGNEEIVAMLLEDPMAGVLLDGATGGGVSALMLAALGGHAAIAKRLLDAMSAEQANARDADGCNALMLAAQNRDADIVRLLLADSRTTQQVFILDGRGLNALTHATLAGSVASVEALLGDSSAVGQAVAISQATMGGMVAKILKEGLETLFSAAGEPVNGATAKRRCTVKEAASYCPPRMMLKLLPVIARKIAERRGQ